MDSNTTRRIHEDLIASDKKGYEEYGVTVDRKDYTQKDWLRHAYEEVLDTAKYLKRAIDTSGTKSPNRAAVDVLLQVDASINTEIGLETTPEERKAFKVVSSLILERCKYLDPDIFEYATPTQIQG